jgi:hypothetical protein
MRHPDYSHVIVSTGGKDHPRPMPMADALATIRRQDQRYDAHLSLARYTPDLLTHVNGNGRLAGYRGPCFSDYLIFDIDRGAHGELLALRDARALALTLHESYRLREDQVRYSYSGAKGFHLAVPTLLAGDVQPSTLTPAILHRVAASIAATAGVEIDQAIYRHLGTVRADRTQHPKTQRWKTEYSWHEFSTWTAQQMVEAATGFEPREFRWEPHDLEPSDSFAVLYERSQQEAEEHANRPVRQPVRLRGEPLDVDGVVEVMRSHYVDGQRHRVATALAGYLAKNGVSQDDAVEVIRKIAADDDDDGEKSVGRVLGTYTTQDNGLDVLGWRGLEEVMEWEGLEELARLVEPGRGGDPAPDGKLRPEISIRQELNAVTDEAVEALLGRPDLNVFVRSGMLVTLARDGADRRKWLKKPPGSLVIRRIESGLLLSLLDEAAHWQKFNAREKAMVSARPPEWVAQQVLSRIEWPFRYLDAVVETPTIRPDGTILDVAGWDEDTGILYEPIEGQRWPGVPDRPSRRDAEEAVVTLLDPVRDFPFVADTDKSAYLAAVLTLLGRQRIEGPVPLFAIRAPAPGTGKGLLAQVIGIIGTGRIPPAMTMSYEGDELRKRITALAMDGSPAVLLDNLSGAVGSDALAAALTATEWEDRILGATQMVRVPLRLVWLATGNNLAFRRTLGRRVIPIDLDAKRETPEDRTGFKYDNLLAHVKEERTNLVAAGLTILRAHHLAAQPRHKEPRMGSFESWDDAVRSAVVWVGLDDPASTADDKGRGRIRAQSDDDIENLGALLETLRDLYPNRLPFSTADVLTKAKDRPELQAVLDAAATPPKGGHATANSLGARFRDHQGRFVSGLVLRKTGRAWAVEATGGES